MAIESSFVNGSAVALGNFDGVHLGHQEIIKNCLTAAKKLGVPSILLSFRPHPATILVPASDYKLIVQYNDKIQYIKSLGIDHVIELDFTPEFSKLTAEEFVQSVLIKQLNIKYLCTGNNFFYGHNRKGDVKKLMQESKQYNFEYQAINQIYMNDYAISSSLIRKMISRGSIETVNQMLGRKYKINGIVNRGKQVAANKLGFPTANMKWDQDLIKPYPGVYISRVKLGNIYKFGVTNIGYKPTVLDDGDFMVETHLLDFSDDLYDMNVAVELLAFLRPERKFDSISALKMQIENDMRSAKYHIGHIASHRFNKRTK